MMPLHFSGFQEVRCPSCNKLLFRVIGITVVEIVCPRCSKKVLWPDLDAVKLLPVVRLSDNVVKAPALLKGSA